MISQKPFPVPTSGLTQRPLYGSGAQVLRYVGEKRPVRHWPATQSSPAHGQEGLCPSLQPQTQLGRRDTTLAHTGPLSTQFLAPASRGAANQPGQTFMGHVSPVGKVTALEVDAVGGAVHFSTGAWVGKSG